MSDLRLATAALRQVHVRAPETIGLSLHVGGRRPDGGHPLTAVQQAVSLYEDLVATADDELRLTVQRRSDRPAVEQPADHLALRAARALAEHTGVVDGAHLRLNPTLPTGCSDGVPADAAAALLACDALWGTGLPREEIAEMGADLGVDVPFSLAGHTAVRTGYDGPLTPALGRGEYHWALGVRGEHLPRADVLTEFDQQTPHPGDLDTEDDVALLQALRAGDAGALGALLHNDLQNAAVELVPGLVEVLAVAEDAGALGVVVCGPGARVAALGRSRKHALAIAAALTATDVVHAVATAAGPVPGARVVGGDTL